MVSRCMKKGEFSEGVRALLVDKDNNPQWNPSNLVDVSNEEIESYFQPLVEFDLNLKF